MPLYFSATQVADQGSARYLPVLLSIHARDLQIFDGDSVVGKLVLADNDAGCGAGSVGLLHLRFGAAVAVAHLGLETGVAQLGDDGNGGILEFRVLPR